MIFSYWEHKIWLKNIDFAIIGSGLVGLSCALQLRQLHPKAKIVIFERGILPSGASTKNAGFTCFGSLSELVDDLKTHSKEEVVALVKERVAGLKLLRNTLGDKNIAYQELGGFELFTETQTALYNECVAQLPAINNLLRPVFNEDVFSIKQDSFNFGNVKKTLIFNKFEGQIDTGKMMRTLLKKAIENDILILNSCEVTNLHQNDQDVTLAVSEIGNVKATNVCIATNGFAKQFIDQDVLPARAQVLVTKPIKNLHIKGTFHLDRGYYYFRNIDNRILLGGGRNLDFKGEMTTKMEVTQQIQDALAQILKTILLPNTPFIIDKNWSGIMGVGSQKKPILKQISKSVFCGVRLGGMGVAIGSSIGKNLADLASQDISA
ncbi:oxidoreductase [unidentified eubacterium SCB49]|nr:oxidoreductase [unidentified eubacterium SCB49]